MPRRKYKAVPADSDNPVDRVMPLVIELLDEDLIPLIRQVIIKRVSLYLAEINNHQEESK